MYLSRLELHGFKSFAQRTVLRFDDGITAIVGPNGCGKSNIVDAVRWVIGEQRARVLRSERMENVIFNGTARRRPLGLAEVQLTIENTRGVLPTEYTEVTLGRRLYRSGESEYLLNGVRCRLQDVVDLFMDTGMGAGAYSVIELKMVDEILSENAQDRRRLFEEAAGITKYKLRRRQALGKLEGTQADLTRLADLTEEIEKRVRSLRRQADRAAQFKAHEARLHHLELVLAQVEHDRLSGQRQALQAEVRVYHEQAEQLTAEQEQEEARLKELRTRLGEREQVLSTRRTARGDHLEQVRSLEADLRLEGERLETARRQRDRIVQEQEEAEARQGALRRDGARLQDELAAAGPALEEAEQALQAAQAARDRTRSAAVAQRERLQQLRRREQRAEDERTHRRRLLDRLNSRRELLVQEGKRAQAQVGAVMEAHAALRGRVEHAARQLGEAQVAVEAAEAAFEAARQDRDARQQALEGAMQALRQAERQRDAAAAEAGLLERLVASYEEVSGAVQFLAATPGWSTAELRTVSDVLACAEEDRLAFDAALGPLASCVVVQSEAEAQQAMALLQAEQQGQATFVVLDRLTAPAAGLRPPGGGTARPLLERAQVADPRYRPLAELLLHETYLVDTLDDAQAAAAASQGASRFFTRKGAWVDARGLVHGGSRSGASAAANRLGRREQLQAARQDLARREAAQARQEAHARRLQADLEAVPFEARQDALAQAERQLREAEAGRARLAYEQEALEHRRRELQEHLEHLRAELQAVRAEAAQLEASTQEAEQVLEQARAARAEAEEAFQAAELESRAALSRFSDLHVAAVQARHRRDTLQHDLDRVEQSLRELAGQAETRAAELERLQQHIAASQAERERLASHLASVLARQTTLEADVAEAEQALAQTKSAVAAVEAHLHTLRQQREQRIRAEHQGAVRLAEVQTRLEDLHAHIREDFGVSLQDRPVEVEEGFDEQAARAEVQDLRARIRALGAVNELALETYEEEKERLDFLKGQQQDLEDAEKTLRGTIDEINATAAARFEETYTAIRDSFVRIFAELFGEDAAADLQLVEPDDPLESPIEIVARPRGKRPSTITQLSGGEKTLTAIALLFAIYLVKPSPFCILDEVDAPLDDANVDRFMHLIRTFAENTQFILVTHNKRTMELADRMYGITMQEQGVSQLVGVQFDEALDLAEG